MTVWLPMNVVWQFFLFSYEFVQSFSAVARLQGGMPKNEKELQSTIPYVRYFALVIHRKKG